MISTVATFIGNSYLVVLKHKMSFFSWEMGMFLFVLLFLGTESVGQPVTGEEALQETFEQTWLGLE